MIIKLIFSCNEHVHVFYLVASSENGGGSVSESTGVINLGAIHMKTRLRHFDLMGVGSAKNDLGLTTGKKSTVRNNIIYLPMWCKKFWLVDSSVQ